MLLNQFLENSSESGKWYHVSDVGEDIIISHPADIPPIYCKFETPFIEDFLHLTRPTLSVWIQWSASTICRPNT